MRVAAWHRRTPESKFTKFGDEMSTGQTPSHAKFCGDPTRIVRDIRDQKFVLAEKVDQTSPKFLRGYCSPGGTLSSTHSCANLCLTHVTMRHLQQCITSMHSMQAMWP